MKTAMYRTRLQTLEKKLATRQAEYNLIEQDKLAEEAKMLKLKSDKEAMELVTSLLVTTADSARDAGRLRLEKVVTKALQYVFGPEFTFEIELGESGGKPVANFFVVTPDPVSGENIRNEPQSSRGGGINDIVAIALQVGVLVVYNEPKIQGPIILDEPGKHVSEDYVVRLGEFLDFISRTFNRQITLVTHQPHLAATAGKCFISQMVSGKTVIGAVDPSLLMWSDDDGESEDESDVGSEEGVS